MLRRAWPNRVRAAHAKPAHQMENSALRCTEFLHRLTIIPPAGNGALLACQGFSAPFDRLGAQEHQIFYLIRSAPNRPIFKLKMRISQRTKRATVAFEDRVFLSTASITKLTPKTAQNKPETALKPVAVRPLPDSTKLDPKCLLELLTYTPPLHLHYKPSESTATDLSKLQTFKKLFTQEIIDIIVSLTNSYVENARETTEEFTHA
jgi:hypothetical protein